jgi:hypothetical protein
MVKFAKNVKLIIARIVIRAKKFATNAQPHISFKKMIALIIVV